jgi:hypothetical protein
LLAEEAEDEVEEPLADGAGEEGESDNEADRTRLILATTRGQSLTQQGGGEAGGRTMMEHRKSLQQHGCC